MKILLTGANGYIARRLLPVLLDQGHELVCCVRDRNRFHLPVEQQARVQVIEIDMLQRASLDGIPSDIDAAYYLVHSMSGGSENFEDQEQTSAAHFRDALAHTRVQQVIYLSGISNDRALSKHLFSRKRVEGSLQSAHYSLTVLRAGIIVGSGSASFEIIRDLVEKLPFMIAPRWLKTQTNPIAIADVISFLTGVLLRTDTYGECYDIYGPEVLTYKEMLLRFANVRNLKRRILVVPVMTPRLSSYWLYFVTATSYSLARNLVDSMRVEVIGRKNDLARRLGIDPMDYETAISKAFDKIDQNMIVSSWKDALNGSTLLSKGLSAYITVPTDGCFIDRRMATVMDLDYTMGKIFAIGGRSGWYYANWLWSIRGLMDKAIGGVGLKRGRKNLTELTPGETLDFWRVIYADRSQRRLLLYAEMKLPGEAWLEFVIKDGNTLVQTATFRPLGLAGRLYWYAVLPFHGFIFRGMLRKLTDPQHQHQDLKQ